VVCGVRRRARPEKGCIAGDGRSTTRQGADVHGCVQAHPLRDRFLGQFARGLTLALSLAEEADAHLWLLHTIEVPPELRVSAVVTEDEIDELNASAHADALSRLRSLIPEEAARFCSIEPATTTGEAAHTILKFAVEHETDLIVMGAQGHGAVDRFVFGSKTRDVIAGTTCPVLTVRR